MDVTVVGDTDSDTVDGFIIGPSSFVFFFIVVVDVAFFARTVLALAVVGSETSTTDGCAGWRTVVLCWSVNNGVVLRIVLGRTTID